MDKSFSSLWSKLYGVCLAFNLFMQLSNKMLRHLAKNDSIFLCEPRISMVGQSSKLKQINNRD